MAARILLADDEDALVRAVTYALEREGYEVDAVADGAEALARARAGGHDLAILDIMMPGASGLAICREIRAESALPIILLTARDAEVDTVVGLEAGADDYVTKPFSVAELMSRVAALLRRRRIDATDRTPVRLSVSGIEIDPLGRTVEVDGHEVRLTSAEFELLALLADAPGRVFTRRAIMEHLWRTPFFGDERAADTHVANIRRKVERDPSRPTRILTVRGVGYKLGATPRSEDIRHSVGESPRLARTTGTPADAGHTPDH
jgi:two-component system, OmpR family, response regulator RegX3